MKYILVVFAVLMSTHFTQAGSKENFFVKGPFYDDKLEHINVKGFDCDEILKLAKRKVLFLSTPPGTIVAGSSTDCLRLHSFEYDFFQPQGVYLRAKGSHCSAWSCDGIRSSGNSG